MSSYVTESRAPVWDEEDRLAALRSFQVLDTDPETAFDSLARVAAHICNAPIALVSLVDGQRQWFKCAIGLNGVRENPREIAFCAHAILQADVFVVPDATKDPRFASNPLVTGEPRLRFYAGVPLITEEGLPLGTLCILDTKARSEGLTPVQKEALLALANAVMGQLKLRQTNKLRADGERRFRMIAETMPQIVWSSGSDGNPDYQNSRWYEFTGQPVGSTGGNAWNRLLHPDDQARAWAQWQNSLTTGNPYESEYRLLHRSGEYHWTLNRALPIHNSAGEIERWFGTCTDIHEQKLATERIQASEGRYRALIETNESIVWLATAEGRMKGDVGWTETSGQEAEEYAGDGWLKAVHPEDRERVRTGWEQAVALATPWDDEFRVQHRDGHYRWVLARGVPLRDDKGAVQEWIGTQTSIHDRKQAEEELWRAANYDALTGIPNRMLFQKRLEQALGEAKQYGTSISLLVIDLDEFKDVNDSFGHDAGDALLKETAARLSATARDCDTVARFGGDEFVVLLAGSSSLEHAATLAEGLVIKLSQPVSYAGQMIASHASIGVAAFPDHDTDAAELMKDADMALYRAKAEGRNRVVTYSPEMRAATEQRIRLRREMREAISLDQIQPFYQPRVCLSTGEIIGFEALARWQHPARGLLTPANFADAFDDPELATMVGKRLIGKVTSDMRRWLNRGLSFGHVAINLSHTEFIQPSLAEDILRILDLAKVPPKHFEIEITEKVLLDAQSHMVSSALDRFRARGVQIALDDFGTGFASLTHLKQFKVDHIKIDQSFVRGIEEDPDDEAIVTAVIGLGRSLNLKVTAEGVETTGQAQRLREMGCSAAQGYLYARPIAGSDVPGFISSWVPQQTSAKRLHLVER